MPRRYPTFDRLLALLLSLLVTATGTATPDTDLADDFDAVDDGASTTDTSQPVAGAVESQRSRTTVIHVPADRTSQADSIWLVAPNRAPGFPGITAIPGSVAVPHFPGAVAVAHDEPLTALVSVITDETDDAQLGELLGRALRHCRTDGDLKVIVSAEGTSAQLRNVVEPHGFMFNRSWREHGRTVAEFYVNLYARPFDGRDRSEPRR